MQVGPPNQHRDSLVGPNSTMVMCMGPLGTVFLQHISSQSGMAKSGICISSPTAEVQSILRRQCNGFCWGRHVSLISN